jgi:hypothetical protein
MTKTCYARITWVGSFPLDMLRYDHCFPARAKDVPLMQSGKGGTIVVAQTVHGDKSDWTPGRWKSVGAELVEVRSSFALLSVGGTD